MRTLLVKLIINWDDYDNVCDDILFDDVFEGFEKAGIEIELIKEDMD